MRSPSNRIETDPAKTPELQSRTLWRGVVEPDR